MACGVQRSLVAVVLVVIAAQERTRRAEAGGPGCLNGCVTAYSARRGRSGLLPTRLRRLEEDGWIRPHVSESDDAAAARWLRDLAADALASASAVERLCGRVSFEHHEEHAHASPTSHHRGGCPRHELRTDSSALDLLGNMQV